MTFEAFFEAMTGEPPYRWQSRLAADALPEVISVETGSGKTAGVVAAWLWRHLLHPEPSVRAGTPRRLVLALPMRVLVSQHSRSIRGWLEQLEVSGTLTPDEVPGLLTLAGGGGSIDTTWVADPERPMVIVGTIDQLLSRALNRGYLIGRRRWPIEFGLLNADTHWVLDEIQLMGPAVATTRQLAAFRDLFGTFGPSSTTWMSATVDPAALSTPDNSVVPEALVLGEEDRVGRLTDVLDAKRTIVKVDPASDPARAIADFVVGHHMPGTRTLVVCNTVSSAQNVHRRLAGAGLPSDPILLHSRFRPPDRTAALASIERAGDVVAVATQVIEAGVDLSASLMVTEVPSWPSLVQRAGRLNRRGELEKATLAWIEPAHPAPYDQAEVASALETLDGLTGLTRTTSELAAAGASRAAAPMFGTMLRRKDLLALFDTQPDLEGNDIDIGPFIRDGDDLDCAVFWRDIEPGKRPGRLALAEPSAEELCPVPVGELRRVQKDLWRFDHLATGDEPRWVLVRDHRREIIPGRHYCVATTSGLYGPDRGWDTAVRSRVVPLAPGRSGDADLESLEDDNLTYGEAWVALDVHLADTKDEARALTSRLDIVPTELAAAVVDAGRLHDIGKIHPTFQASLRCQAADDPARLDWIDENGPLAKSVRTRSCPYDRRGFRHELVSALMLLNPESHLLDDVQEPELVAYLVAAHHGQIRLGARPLPRRGDRPADDASMVRGVADGDVVDPVSGPGFSTPQIEMDLTIFALGRSEDGRRSWTSMALDLLGRDDLGPFRLAYLEALVRVADWRASRRHGGGS